VVKIGLELPRGELYRRIDDRMDQMIAAGLFEEAKELYIYKDHNALQTVGYQEIFDYMDGKYDRDEAVRLLKRNSRRYAKRQLTWFKRDEEIHWMHPQDIAGILKLIN
jgi:tRNA dimethylallyltransferase